MTKMADLKVNIMMDLYDSINSLIHNTKCMFKRVSTYLLKL